MQLGYTHDPPIIQKVHGSLKMGRGELGGVKNIKFVIV